MLCKNYFYPLFFTLFLFSFDAFSQNSTITEAYKQDVKIRKTGMAILGTWAVGNMITGAIGRNQATGQNAYFHEMNLIWNVVNLGIAGAGYYFTATGEMPENASALLDDQVSFQKNFTIQCGLGFGLYSWWFLLDGKSEKHNQQTRKIKRLR